MRIGDILLEHGWVDEDSLARAVAEQPRSGVRLCSLLVERGALGFDHAARALGEQLEVACVLQRHLEHRDHSLAALLPPDFARTAVALPIGRMGNGAVIICVREPSAVLERAIAGVLDEPFLLAVTPARRLERLVAHAYREPDLEIDIEVELPPPAPEPDVDFEIEVDLGVIKPPPPRTAPRTAIAIPMSALKPAIAATPKPVPGASSLEGTIARFADIDTSEWLFEVVMAYVAKRWTSSRLFTIHDVAAHGGTLTLPLSTSSIVRLAKALGNPRHPAAAALIDAGAVTHVLVVGDPLGDDPDDATVDLARLAEAIDEARARMR